MIYRIVVDCLESVIRDPETYHIVGREYRMRGAGRCLGLPMWVLGLPAPHITNPRARFYFTEDGWQRVGRYVALAGQQAGHQMKVIRRKNPRRSQIVYQDALQVAILPAKTRNTPKSA